MMSSSFAQNPNNTPSPFFLCLALFPPFLYYQTENLLNCEQYNSLPLLKQIFHHLIKTKQAFQKKKKKTQSIFPFFQHFQSSYNKTLKLHLKKNNNNNLLSNQTEHYPENKLTSRAWLYRLRARRSRTMRWSSRLLTLLPSCTHWSRTGTTLKEGSPIGQILEKRFLLLVVPCFPVL